MQHNLTPSERFWPKVEKHGLNGCWVWTGAQTPEGYGMFWNGHRRVGAHRFAFENSTGPIPAGLQLDHLCRIPSCVNPTHLEPVTRSVNILRGNNPCREKTHCPKGHPYEGRNLMISTRGNGQHFRKCRACTTEGAKRRKRNE